jgi:hypothetical protein
MAANTAITAKILFIMSFPFLWFIKFAKEAESNQLKLRLTKTALSTPAHPGQGLSANLYLQVIFMIFGYHLRLSPPSKTPIRNSNSGLGFKSTHIKSQGYFIEKKTYCQ